MRTGFECRSNPQLVCARLYYYNKNYTQVIFPSNFCFPIRFQGVSLLFTEPRGSRSKNFKFLKKDNCYAWLPVDCVDGLHLRVIVVLHELGQLHLT
jgi:hypothetical protein